MRSFSSRRTSDRASKSTSARPTSITTTMAHRSRHLQCGRRVLQCGRRLRQRGTRHSSSHSHRKTRGLASRSTSARPMCTITTRASPCYSRAPWAFRLRLRKTTHHHGRHRRSDWRSDRRPSPEPPSAPLSGSCSSASGRHSTCRCRRPLSRPGRRRRSSLCRPRLLTEARREARQTLRHSPEEHWTPGTVLDAHHPVYFGDERVESRQLRLPRLSVHWV